MNTNTKTTTAKRLAFLWALFGLLFISAASAQRVPAPHDWSHRHLIYSNPDTLEEAMAKGEWNEWARNYRDPRFVLALVRNMENQDAEAVQAKARGANNGTSGSRNGNGGNNNNGNSGNNNNGNNGNNNNGNSGNGNGGNKASPLHRDWSYVMGGAGGVGFAGTFPAKYNFDISAAPSCANDFVVFPTATAGVNGSGVRASQTGTVQGDLGTGAAATVTITNGTRTLTLTSSATLNTGLNFMGNTGTAATDASNLANAINRNGGTVGVSAVAAGTTVTVTALAQGAGGNAIALNQNLNNFQWNGNNLAGGSGTAGQPTIFALNQLYSSCGTSTVGAPSVLWSYNTGAGATADTSPILSLDGTQVAFVQRSGTNVASLVLLKWSAAAPGTVAAPTTPAAATAGTYRACAAPCMLVMPLSGNPSDTNSSPYYDYSGDTLWVGDNSGVLHRFSGVFSGTPAESGAPWPVTVVAGRILSSPVYDASTGLVFVGSAREPTTTNGGRLHSVNDATGAVITSGLLAGNPTGNLGSQGVAEAPVVDQLAQRVYTFVATDTSASCGGVQCHAVYQFATNVTINGLTAPKQTLGRGDVYTKVLHAGIFDNAYYASTPASPTGTLYVCGSESTGASSRRPTLWRIPIAANAMGAAAAGPGLVSADTSDASGGGGSCSPITDIQNGANNYIFMSVPQLGNQTGCAGSCIYMFNLTGVTVANWAASTAVAGLTAAGGTSGIVIDNSSSVTGASQIYYMTLTNPGNAIQASQAALN